MIDSSNIRAHQHAAGAVGGQKRQALGRSRGGFGTKLHAKVDSFGMPLRICITGGEKHESGQAVRLYATDRCKFLLADKGYDNGAFRDFLGNNNTLAVIPGRRNRREAIIYDKAIYKERNFVERFFNRIKQYRRVATRYDKLAVTFMGTIVIACIMIWLKA